jgi:hypothetical protein
MRPNRLPTDLWQHCFCEHFICDEADYAHHVTRTLESGQTWLGKKGIRLAFFFISSLCTSWNVTD